MRPSSAFVLALFLGAMAGAACGGKPPCGPANCTGCCDSAGACQTGFTTLACGVGGNVCQPCFANQVCSLGNCLGGTGGAAGGGSGGGGGGGATGGGVGGGGGGGATGGGQGGGGSTCGPGTCDGCCTSAGACAGGRNISACGFAGAACVVCAGNESCEPVGTSSFGGRCASGSGGGGGTGGGAGGGGATGGGAGGGGVPTGGGTGGGSLGGGAGGGGGGGSCNSTSCPTGCCQGSACITNQSAAQCGTFGNVCTACLTGQTCVGGQCRQCTGCISSLGVCEFGTSDQACGRNGALCQMCVTPLQTCQAGMCSFGTGGGTGGGAGGGGFGGGAGGGGTGGGTGGGGGLPIDGGIDLCALLGTPCGSNQCCDGITCVNALAICTFSMGICNPVTHQCQ
ncbi:MAG: hypothetical protein AB1938_13315 [Myxococcota bacterium]